MVSPQTTQRTSRYRPPHLARVVVDFDLSALTSTQVVLANGTAVNANADTNSDLFWALKGGGPNFGIVTRFDLYTIPVSQIWCQLSIYAPDQALNVLDAFSQWQNEGASDYKSIVALSLGLDTISVGLLYSSPTDHPSVFAHFDRLHPLQVIVPPSNITFAYLSEVLEGVIPILPGR